MTSISAALTAYSPIEFITELDIRVKKKHTSSNFIR